MIKELLRQKSGAVGVALLIVLVVAAVVSYVEFQKYIPLWRDTNYWAKYPSAVPPEWTSIFNPSSAVPTKVIKPAKVFKKTLFGTATNVTYLFVLNYKWDVPPNDLKLVLSVNATRPPAVIVYFVRPDGEKVKVLQDVASNLPNLMSFNNFDEIKSNVMNWAQLRGVSAATPVQALFGGNKTLKGKYEVIVTLVGLGKFKSRCSLILDGTVYGLMGTDVFGRDIFVYTMIGLPFGLVVGVLASVVAAVWGTLYGLVSGYAGGRVDQVLQRVLEVWYSIPALPLLIMLTIVIRPSIWLITVLIAIFSWMGVAKVVRSMVLQLKNEGYVQASKAVGAPSRWVMFKHILPQIVPYTMAQVALGVPGAILTEVSLDFLGLGDPNVPTWGWMLHDANVYGAAVNGYWWWVVPPGLMVAMVALAFALIGYAMDVVLNPRLREE